MKKCAFCNLPKKSHKDGLCYAHNREKYANMAMGDNSYNPTTHLQKYEHSATLVNVLIQIETRLQELVDLHKKPGSCCK